MQNDLGSDDSYFEIANEEIDNCSQIFAPLLPVNSIDLDLGKKLKIQMFSDIQKYFHEILSLQNMF